MVRHNYLIFYFLFFWGVVLCSFLPSFASNWQDVDFDQYIQKEKRDLAGGKKLITFAKPVSFAAKMKRKPEKRQMSYVYTTLEVAGIEKMPEIEHRMFVESKKGQILPVYVEKATAARIAEKIEIEEMTRFFGYHVYSYAKGPAILVVDFKKF